MLLSNSKAPAMVSTPPPDKVVGGPQDIASESDCVNSVHSGVDECKVINVESVPGSSVKKGLEKPPCGPSEPVSFSAGNYSELFNQFVSFMNHHRAFLCLRLRSGRRHYVFGSSVRPYVRMSVRLYVRTSVPFCLCRYLKNCEAVLHQTWYEGISWGTILCVDFEVTGSKVKGHRLFCVNLVQCLAYYET